KMGGSSYIIDTSTGNLATDQTPLNERQEVVVPSYHSILYWVNKDDPLGPPPANPYDDPQFSHWEYAVQAWATSPGITTPTVPPPTQTSPQASSTASGLPEQSGPTFVINSPASGALFSKTDTMPVILGYTGQNPFLKVDYYINGDLIGTSQSENFG